MALKKENYFGSRSAAARLFDQERQKMIRKYEISTVLASEEGKEGSQARKV
jgi:hypothetical protein